MAFNIKDSTLNIVIKAKDRASGTLRAFDKQAKKSIGAGTLAAGAVQAVGVAVGGLAIKMGVDAIQGAIAFEKSMSNVSTLIDESKESMDSMGDAVLEIAKQTPVAIDELTSALYDVRSAGIEADSAMGTLSASAELAVTGLGTTKEAANLVTSAINAFSLDADKSKEHANVFFEAVKAGKTTVAELAVGFGQIAPLASGLNIQFEELMGTTAAMTTSGMSASIAYTQIKAALSNLQKPTKEMQELYDKLGITNIQTEIQQKGLISTVRELTEATDGDNQMLAKAFGSVEALNAVMMLNNETGDKAIEIYSGMTDGVNNMDEAFQKQKETVTAQMEMFGNNIRVIQIQVGEKLLPIINSALSALTELLSASNQEKIGKSISSIDEANQKLITLRDERLAAGKDVDNLNKQIAESMDIQREMSEDLTKSKVGETIKGTAGAVGTLGGILPWVQEKIWGFADGGTVPGAKGEPMLAMVHGGEQITPPDKQTGGNIVFDLRNATLTDKNIIEKMREASNKMFNVAKFSN